MDLLRKYLEVAMLVFSLSCSLVFVAPGNREIRFRVLFPHHSVSFTNKL